MTDWSFGVKSQQVIWGPTTKCLGMKFENKFNELYGTCAQMWGNDAASGLLFVEGVYSLPREDILLPGSVAIELKDIKTKDGKTTGKGEIDCTLAEDWTTKGITKGSRIKIKGSSKPFDIELTRFTAPKYVGSAAKSKFIRATIEFVFIDPPPAADEPSATAVTVVVDCIVPRAAAIKAIDAFIKERYLSGDLRGWDITALRQALIGLLDPETNAQRLISTKAYLDPKKVDADYAAGNREYEAAYIVMAHTVMAHIVMASIVMAGRQQRIRGCSGIGASERRRPCRVGRTRSEPPAAPSQWTAD